MLTMLILIITSSVHWGRVGNTQLTENWVGYRAHTVKGTAKQLFNGFCIGMLGLTGFECPSSIQYSQLL
jgi:hypothetical protein